jgi:hypothetical protein
VREITALDATSTPSRRSVYRFSAVNGDFGPKWRTKSPHRSRKCGEEDAAWKGKARFLGGDPRSPCAGLRRLPLRRVPESVGDGFGSAAGLYPVDVPSAQHRPAQARDPLVDRVDFRQCYQSCFPCDKEELAEVHDPRLVQLGIAGREVVGPAIVGDDATSPSDGRAHALSFSQVFGRVVSWSIHSCL